ncbi:MAG: tetratricopeptide repeat protein [Pseudobdellovibrio sp.]
MFFIRLILISLVVFSCANKQKAEEKANLHMQLGLSYLERQEYALALKELLSAEEADPNNSLVQNNLGLVYFIREKYDLSIKHFSNAYNLNKKFTEAKNNLARTYIEIKDYKKAQILLDEVLADLTYTETAKAYMNYGLLEFNQDHFKNAKIYFKKTLQTYRDDCYAKLYLGRCSLELKETAAALAQLEKATTFCKDIGVDGAHYYAAIANYRSGRKDQALIRFKEVISQFPNGAYRDQAKKMINLIEKGTL